VSSVVLDSAPPSTLMSALHESRRRDAARIVHRYRHLVADREVSLPLAATEASARSATNEGEIRISRKLSADFLVALVLLGFGVAHVWAVVAIQRAAIPHAQHASLLAQGD
jgi:hypothetical protein